MDFIVTTSANSTICILGCLIVLILALSIYFKKDTATRQGRVFFILLILTFVTFSSDLVAIVLDTVPGEVPRVLCVIGNIIAYISTALAIVAYIIYIYICLLHKVNASRIGLYIGVALTAVYLLLIIASQFNGMLYSISADNVYSIGPYYNIALVYVLILQTIELAIVLYYRKAIGTKDTMIISSYAYIPLITNFVHFIYPELMLNYIAIIMALIIIYVNFQSRQSEKLKLELAENKTAIMLSQIKPHFLYNTLNTISNIYDDNEEANQALKTFSEYMRGNMDSLSQKGLIPFEKELAHTKQYLSLEKLRFRERLHVEYDLQTEDFSLPVLTLQPIVENAVRHGVTQKRKGGTVKIQTEETAGSYRIVVTDDGVGFDPQAPTREGQSHMGIANVRSRLAAMCGGRLMVESAHGKGTSITIEIPKERGGGA